MRWAGRRTRRPRRHLSRSGCAVTGGKTAAHCRSIAVRDREFCSFHLNHRGRRLCIARARARRERLPLQLPPLEDMYAVQVGIMQVTDWLLNGKLDRRDARLALSALRQAATNLRQPPEVWKTPGPSKARSNWSCRASRLSTACPRA